jgi:hypothetical protein
MSIISPAIKGFMMLRQSAIDNFMLNPIDTQQQVFNDLVGTAQFTEYGKKYGFEKINSIADFKKHVPINDYDTLKPYTPHTGRRAKPALAFAYHLVCQI